MVIMMAAAQTDQGVGGVHLAFDGDDDCNHDDGEHLLSTYRVLVSPTRSHRSQLSFLDHHLSWELR